MNINIDKIQIKSGNEVNLPSLDRGELALTIDKKELHVGDGVDKVTFVDKSSLIDNGKVKSSILDIATTTEAEAGLNDTKVMTPKKVMECIKSNASGGVTLNTFRSGVIDGSFTATEVTSTFTIPNWNNRVVIDVMIYDSIPLIKGLDYNINAETGTVTLNWELKVGERIDFTVSGQSYNYNDLSNAPVVKNNLTETVVGNVLDATQGKVLNDKIVANTGQINSLNETTVKNNKQGRIIHNNGKTITTPLSNTDTQLWLETTDLSPTGITFISQGVAGWNLWGSNDGLHLSNFGGGNDVKIATTDKIDISFPYNTGFEDIDQYAKSRITKSNNLVQLTINVKKSGGNFILQDIIGTVPVEYRPLHYCSNGARTYPVTGGASVFVYPNGNVGVQNANSSIQAHCTITYFTN